MKNLLQLVSNKIVNNQLQSLIIVLSNRKSHLLPDNCEKRNSTLFSHKNKDINEKLCPE